MALANLWIVHSVLIVQVINSMQQNAYSHIIGRRNSVKKTGVFDIADNYTSWEFDRAKNNHIFLDITGSWEKSGSESCEGLHTDHDESWMPMLCTHNRVPSGTECNTKCTEEGTSLYGASRMYCNNTKWTRPHDITTRPLCLSLEEIAYKLDETLKKMVELYNYPLVLFVINEESNINETDFRASLKFIENLRSNPIFDFTEAGVIAFSTNARVIVEISESNKCHFIRTLHAHQQMGEPNSDFSIGFNEAIKQIKLFDHINKKVIVFFITNTVDQDQENNWVKYVDTLKHNGHVVYTIGVGNSDRAQLEDMASVFNNNLCFLKLANSSELTNLGLNLEKIYGRVFSTSQCNLWI